MSCTLPSVGDHIKMIAFILPHQNQQETDKCIKIPDWTSYVCRRCHQILAQKRANTLRYHRILVKQTTRMLTNECTFESYAFNWFVLVVFLSFFRRKSFKWIYYKWKEFSVTGFKRNYTLNIHSRILWSLNLKECYRFIWVIWCIIFKKQNRCTSTIKMTIDISTETLKKLGKFWMRGR